MYILGIHSANALPLQLASMSPIKGSEGIDDFFTTMLPFAGSQIVIDQSGRAQSIEQKRVALAWDYCNAITLKTATLGRSYASSIVSLQYP